MISEFIRGPVSSIGGLSAHESQRAHVRNCEVRLFLLPGNWSLGLGFVKKYHLEKDQVSSQVQFSSDSQLINHWRNIMCKQYQTSLSPWEHSWGSLIPPYCRPTSFSAGRVRDSYQDWWQQGQWCGGTGGTGGTWGTWTCGRGCGRGCGNGWTSWGSWGGPWNMSKLDKLVFDWMSCCLCGDSFIPKLQGYSTTISVFSESVSVLLYHNCWKKAE